MSAGGANITVAPISSNRAPLYSDDVVDGVLLAPAASKTIRVHDTLGNQAFAVAVTIVNGSGQAANVLINAVRGVAGTNSIGISQPVIDGAGTETAIYIDNGESWGPILVRTSSIVETNVGSSAQSGRGVRYLFTLESAK